MPTHDVCFSAGDPSLVHRVASFAKEGLQRGETVIVVATPAHRSDIKARLMMENQIGLSAPRDASYVTLDAADTLSLFCAEEWPDEHLFLEVMGQVITSASKGEPVRIYGEMVALLWGAGRQRAAIRLECLWNELAKRQSFALLCGYPASVMRRSEHSLVEEVRACHATVYEEGTGGWGAVCA